ncbi:MAG: rod shape-determining protein MreC [Coriobacteriia bacterium]|nr:rod shape-determining protein MreC [Coriobacteriia bacterium]
MAFKGQHQKNSFKRTSVFPGFRLFAILVVLSFVIMTVYAREGENGPIHTFKSGIMLITSPIKSVSSVLVSPVGGLSNIMRNATADEASLIELELENARLRNQNASLIEAQKEAERLEGLLGLKSTYHLKTQSARVIGGSSDSWNKSITIDKGSSSGLALDMPVLNSYGLVGQISEITANSASVRLVNDESSGISAMIQSSRAEGIVQGNPDGSLSLNFVTSGSTVVRGDIVITSGMGGVYPRGIPIGEVVNVSSDPNNLYYSIQMQVPYDYKSFEEVLIITQLNAPEDQPIAGVKSSNEDFSQETSPLASQIPSMTPEETSSTAQEEQ